MFFKNNMYYQCKEIYKTQKNKYFYNLNDNKKGILRELGDGIKTRIFPGEKAMVSVVSINTNSTGKIHSTQQEQWI